MKVDMSHDKTHDEVLSLADSVKDDNSISKNIFEEIVWSFPDIIHSVDRNGHILSTNKKATELLGYSLDELIGKSIYELYPEEIQDKVKLGFKELKKVGLIQGVQTQMLTKSGEKISIEIRSISIYRGDEFIKTFSIIRDLREVASLKSQLHEQSKLASIGELSAGIIHDIRNPLSIITSYNHFLKKAIENNDANLLEKIPEKIDKAAKHIARLTTHLQQFMRQEVRPIEEVELSEMLDNCLLIVENRIKASGAFLTNNTLEKSICFWARSDKIEQVIINLISNAADALKDSEIHEKKITLDAKTADDKVLIQVIDNGPGIKQEHLEQIFQAFFTTKDKEQGTGLGLSICRGIIEEEQGSLDVESTVGEGTTFTLTLPLSQQS
ncbi:MAG: ATP-binding protein [Oligoflexales bacterium]